MDSNGYLVYFFFLTVGPFLKKHTGFNVHFIHGGALINSKFRYAYSNSELRSFDYNGPSWFVF